MRGAQSWPCGRAGFDLMRDDVHTCTHLGLFVAHALALIDRRSAQMLWNAALNDKIQPPAAHSKAKIQGLHNSAWLWQHGATLTGQPEKHQPFH